MPDPLFSQPPDGFNTFHGPGSCLSLASFAFGTQMMQQGRAGSGSRDPVKRFQGLVMVSQNIVVAFPRFCQIPQDREAIRCLQGLRSALSGSAGKRPPPGRG